MAGDNNSLFTTDGSALSILEREAPVLSRLRRFAQGLEDTRWFIHLGEPPSSQVRDLADDFVCALGFPEVELGIAPTWEDAAAAAETHDWSSASWEAEELARADLTARALEVVSEEALNVALQTVAQHIGDAAKASMEEEAAYWDMDEDGPRHLAVGAAAQATHGAALLLIASAADPELVAATHPMALKLQLFELGRWPVAIVGGTFTIF